jgi:hypothetical protein
LKKKKIFSCVTPPSLLFSICTPAVSDQNTHREFGHDYKQELGAESKNKITPAESETHHNNTLE